MHSSVAKRIHNISRVHESTRHHILPAKKIIERLSPKEIHEISSREPRHSGDFRKATVLRMR